jgi:hypothetical protein
MKHALIPVGLLAALAACSEEAPQVPAGTEIAANGAATVPPPQPTPAVLPTATGPGTAFGLSTNQLEDAELVDTSGAELGEVEWVENDPQGNVTGVIVELDGTKPDRLVRVPIMGLTAVADDKEWRLRTNATKEQLVALPAVPRPK